MSEPERTEPVWLTTIQVKMLQAAVLNLFGGSPGLRDEDLIESAVARSRQRWAYDDEVTLFELAASYGFGIAKNQASLDGDKRTALLAIRAFLFRNGYSLSPGEVETVTMIEGLADGSVMEVLLAEWIEGNVSSRTQ